VTESAVMRGRETEHLLVPDPARVVTLIFLPGQEFSAGGPSRSPDVLERVLSLSDEEVEVELGALHQVFRARHRDIERTWEANFARVEHRVPSPQSLSLARRRLLGAYFTKEYAVEAAAIFNPSMSRHPDQSGLEPGATRFVMTLRAVGEGHISSIELRSGVIDGDDQVRLDPPPAVAVLAGPVPPRWSRAAIASQLDDMWGDHTNSDFVLSLLPDVFDRADLDRALDALHQERLTRGAALRTVDRFELLVACSYDVEFDASSALQERVLFPRAPHERQGMEDLRMLRFTDDAGESRYLGTYTAYDGAHIVQQLLSTSDFRSFSVTRLTGPGSGDKGLALFPRKIAGRYAALSRADRENNAIAWSDDLLHWEEPILVQRPEHWWEMVQLGNCGAPIETELGWIALTHGVGPMRQYSIGALLLDLDDPTVVIGRLAVPLLAPDPAMRSGYVPNVVYSCGAMLHGRTLVIPYGCNDATTRIAFVPLDPLLADLTASAATTTSSVAATLEESA
jgi:predicted GH43/DUF377 family glycosyl hydrolase